MTHGQMFKYCDNEDGYVSVIIHRERFIEDLKSMGFVETLNEVKQKERKKPGPKPKTQEE